MTETTPIPVAVVGVGRMGRHHARIYRALPGAELVAVVDADEERAATVAEEHGCAAVGSAAELLERFPHVAAATVAVPTGHHETVATTLLRRGIPCLIEKPLAETAAAARRIVEVAEKAGTFVQVGHTERFNPAVRAIGELQITPRFIEVDRVSPMRFRSIDVGVVFDIMIHDVDIVLMMCRSRLKEVRATGVVVLGEHEDVANARLEFEDGCVANLTASRLAMKTERKLRVFSEMAYISLDYAKKAGVIINRKDNTDALQRVRRQIAEGADLSDVDYTELVNVREIAIGDEEPLQAELSNFLEAVAGREEPAVSGRAGCRAVECAERIVEAIYQHQWDGLEGVRLT